MTQPTKGSSRRSAGSAPTRDARSKLVAGGKIICPCHGSQFSIKDGSVVGGPAPAPLPPRRSGQGRRTSSSADGLTLSRQRPRTVGPELSARAVGLWRG